MTSPHAAGPAGVLPAPFTGVPLLLLCILVTLMFTVVRFPFERLEPALRDALADATGATISVRSLGIRPSLGLVGLKAEGVELSWGAGASLQAEAVSVRPAWSTSWLRGRPSIHLAASDGAATPPQVPVSIPFESLEAELAFQKETIGLRRLALDGPMIGASASGSVSPQALEVDGEITARDPGVAGLLRPTGLRVDDEGVAAFTLRGTPQQPILR